MPRKPISVENFAKFLSEQKDLKDFFNLHHTEVDPNDKFLGKPAKPKVSLKHIAEEIGADQSQISLLEDFFISGGTVKKIEGKNVTLETESGTVVVPRYCIKIKKDEE